MSKPKNLNEVVESLGGVMKAASVMGEKNYQTVQAWINKGRVPHNKVLSVHKKTQIPLGVLNPDLYGDHVIQAETQPHSK